MNKTNRLAKIAIILASCLCAPALAEPVNMNNFVRAETDHMMRLNMEAMGLTIGKVNHNREPVTPANQTVIRSNQDTPGAGAEIQAR